ncbi:protein kinase [Nocardia sp. NPDC050406]|uniref:serine/threonine-protein kinase n=1 Tax=Nocardia sp. NPDC050406 TaxID=3364318 RepID=UPI0037948607
MRGPVVQLGVNDTFAGYRLERVLGRGGMGTVYLAAHPRLPRRIALKLLNREVSADEEMRRRFDREANVIAQLDHPNIVGIHDRGVDDGHLWIAMQYVHGTDAARLDPRAVPVERALRIIADTAAALDYAHSRGILHRDVKPANILLSAPETGREERAVLTDFGIAALADNNTQLTATGIVSATLAFASPEQLSGERVDHRADQYSLACTLFALLTGQGPFPATNPGQIVAGHLSKPVPRLSQVRHDVPAALDEVVARAAAKDRNARFASCAEFAAAARAALTGGVAAGRVAPTAHAAGRATSATHLPPTRAFPEPVAPTRHAPRNPHRPSTPRTPHPQPAAANSPARRATDDSPRSRGRGAAVAAGLLALGCALFAFGCVLKLCEPYGGVAEAPRNLRYLEMPALVAFAGLTGYALLVALLLLGGAIRLLLGRRGGRRLTVLGSLGLLVGLPASHVAAQYASVHNGRYTRWLIPLLDPLLASSAIGLSAIVMVMAVAALICAAVARR